MGQDDHPNPSVAGTAKQETTTESFLSQPEAPSSTNYLIGPEDILDIDVLNVPELTRSVRVDNDGTIILPLLGPVQAAGLTTDQLREELEAKWGDTYLQDPEVGVFVREYRARTVSVIGAVEKPGMYPLTGPRTLIEVLSMAGGTSKRVSGSAGRLVYVTRKGNFEDLPDAKGLRLVAPDRVEIDLRELLFSQQALLNIEIKPFDIVSVPPADIVYVTGGGVRRPGGFVLEDREKVTVLQALAMAEGLGPNALKSDGRIIRRAGNGSRTEIPVDVGRVLKGRAPDLQLEANDILFVPDSTQKAALKRGAEAAISTLSGVLIFHR